MTLGNIALGKPVSDSKTASPPAEFPALGTGTIQRKKHEIQIIADSESVRRSDAPYQFAVR